MIPDNTCSKSVASGGDLLHVSSEPMHVQHVVYKEGRSAINLNTLGKLAKVDPGLFIYVRPVGGLQAYLC